MQTKKETLVDAILVLECQQGNRSAFEKLINRWQEHLVKHACSITGNKEIAQDIVQETWITLVEKIDGLDEPNALPKWLYRVVGNKCADWFRQCYKEKKKIENYCAQRQSKEQQDTPLGLLLAAIEKLSVSQKELISMYYAQNLPIETIADILQIKKGTIKSRLYYTREKLQQLMKDSKNGY